MDSKAVFLSSLKALLVISLVFILLANSFQFITFNNRFYCYEFQKQVVYDKLSEHEVDCTIANTITSYVRNDLRKSHTHFSVWRIISEHPKNPFSLDFYDFKQKQDSLIDIDFFNQDEKQHMLDVKVLINKIQTFYYFALGISVLGLLALFVINKKEFNKNLGKVFLIASLLTITFTITFVLLSLNFDFIFTKFHELFFPQGNWLFPYDSKMIILFPIGFFVEGFAWMLLLNVVQSFLLLLISFFILIKKIKII